MKHNPQIGGASIPTHLIEEIKNKKLVIFAGAGISVPPPSCLPNFIGLAKGLGYDANILYDSSISIEVFLGKLYRNEVNVHELTEQKLNKVSKSNDLHRALWELANISGEKIVTTNFDLLFEDAHENIADMPIYTASALPVMSDYKKGLVHIHGALTNCQGMVLTDRDFGRAYITECWASRFLCELFREYTVLFVGYSHEDTILQYLAKALPQNESERKRYSLCLNDDKLDFWNALGINPIEYGDNYNSLPVVLNELIKWISNPLHIRVSEISTIAESLPPQEKNETINLLHQLEDSVCLYNFLTIASSWEWVEWFEANGQLKDLFHPSNKEYNKRTHFISIWLINSFSIVEANKLMSLIANLETPVDIQLWQMIINKLARELKNGNIDKCIIEKWLIVLIEKAPRMSGRCDLVYHSLINLILETSSYYLLLSFFSLIISNINSFQKSWFNDRLVIHNNPRKGHSYLFNLWERLKHEIDEIPSQLFYFFVDYLTKIYKEELIWTGSNNSSNNESCTTVFDNMGVTNYSCDYFKFSMLVIRDKGLNIANNSQEYTKRVCDSLITAPIVICHRIAIYIVTKTNTLFADDKIKWYLSNKNLHTKECFHECCLLINSIFSQVSLELKVDFFSGLPRIQLSSEEINRELEYKKAWLSYLNKEHSEDLLLSEEYSKVFRNVKDSFNRPEFLGKSYINRGRPLSGVYKSIANSEELLAIDPENDYQKVVDLIHQSSHYYEKNDLTCLQREIKESIRSNNQWGYLIVKNLIHNKIFDSEVFGSLLFLYDNDGYDEFLKDVFPLLNHQQLITENIYGISRFLNRLTYNIELIDNNECISTFIQITQTLMMCPEETDNPEDLESEIDNNSHGIAIQSLFKLLFKSSSEKVQSKYTGEIFVAIEKLYQKVESKKVKAYFYFLFGYYIRIILWSKASFFYDFIYPLFRVNDSTTAYSLWTGYLAEGGNIYKGYYKEFKRIYLWGIINIHLIDDKRESFVYTFTNHLLWFPKNPLGRLGKKFFFSISSEERHKFCESIATYLEQTIDQELDKGWDKWLKQYWEGRNNGIYGRGKTSFEELNVMLEWIPFLKCGFNDAVSLFLEHSWSYIEHQFNSKALHHFDHYPYVEDNFKSILSLFDFLSKTNLLSDLNWDCDILFKKLNDLELQSEDQILWKDIMYRVGYPRKSNFR